MGRERKGRVGRERGGEVREEEGKWYSPLFRKKVAPLQC